MCYPIPEYKVHRPSLTTSFAAEAAFALAWVYELYDMERFAGTCIGVYMADNHCESPANFITVNVILHYIYWTCANLIPEQREEYFNFSGQCGVNAETALSSLPLHLPAEVDMIAALSLGVCHSCARHLIVVVHLS